jgi:hypothetical protein
MLPGLLQRLGVAEVVGAGKELPRAVEPPGGQQLLGPDQAERLTQLRPDEVLPALTAVEGQVRGLGPHAAHQHGEELGVLVVGVGADHEDPPVVTQHPELPVEGHDAPGAGRLQLGVDRDAREREQREDEGEEAGECEAQGVPGAVWVRVRESYTVPGQDSKPK